MKAATKSILWILLLASPLWSQATGEVRGKVTDGAQQPVVSAFVVITGQDTSLMRAATTDEAGEFEFAALPVGSYGLQVKAEGFATLETTTLRASIGQVVQLKLVLSPEGGQGNRPAQVATAMVETGSAQLGVVMGELEVGKLPLKARDTYELLQLQPGVQSTVGADLYFGSDQPGVVSVNGARARSNNYNVNGGHASGQMVNAPAIQPSPDSISEFRVLSHNYDAALGRNSGSVLNVITKSGSSGFHGLLYEYLRNNALNAKGYFDPAVTHFKQNEFGGTVGGPIRQNQTFFFASYDGRRVRRGISSDATEVPSEAERAGDFSAGSTFLGVLQDDTVAQALLNRPGCAAAITAQGGIAPSAGANYTDIFPGNVIPSACWDPTAGDLLQQFVPQANAADQMFLATPNGSVRGDRLTFRLDHNLTSQQQLTFYYYGSDGFDLEPFDRFQASGANLPGFGSLTRERFQQVNLAHVWTINAKTVNEARFAFFRDGQGHLNSPARTHLVQDSCVTVPAEQCFADPNNPRLGVTPGLGADLEGVPYISLGGGFSIGNNLSGSFRQTGNVYQGMDVYSRVLGPHTLKFGADMRNQRFHQLYIYDPNGSFSYYGGGPNDVGFDNPLPNYLLGLPDFYTQGTANYVEPRTRQLHLFVQDSWKARPTLTLNYGLRWEWNTPQADVSRRIQKFVPGQATGSYPCVLSDSNPMTGVYGSTDCSPSGPARALFPLGMVFPGDPGVSEALTRPYLRSFAPRLGLAWSPGWTSGWRSKLAGGPGKTSVRLGWGLFYDADEELVLGENFAAQPPFGGSTFLTNTFFNTPFLAQSGAVVPNPYGGILDPKPGSNVDFAVFRPITLYGNFPDTKRSQYAAHYHLTLQRELSRNTLLQVGYVGSQGHRLLAVVDQNYGVAQPCLDLNQIPGQFCGPFGADSAYYIPAGAIPAGVTLHLPYGSVPSVTGPNANPITLVGLRRYSSPFCEPTTGADCPLDGVPVFGSIFSIEPLGQSSYNSFQGLLNRRFSRGLQFLLSYTWSKTFDNSSSFESLVNPLDPRASRSLSLFDARHRLALSQYWRLPETKGDGWSRHLVNGWALSSILTVQSGFPIRLTSSSDQELMSSLDYEAPGQPDQVAAFRRLRPQSSGGYYFDPASFAESALGQIGNTQRTICCGPGIANLDLAVHKTMLVREGVNVEFRAESFNIFNHTQFLNPDGNISDGAQFGQVRRARDPRLFQLALRLSF